MIGGLDELSQALTSLTPRELLAVFEFLRPAVMLPMLSEACERSQAEKIEKGQEFPTEISILTRIDLDRDFLRDACARSVPRQRMGGSLNWNPCNKSSKPNSQNYLRRLPVLAKPDILSQHGSELLELPASTDASRPPIHRKTSVPSQHKQFETRNLRFNGRLNQKHQFPSITMRLSSGLVLAGMAGHALAHGDHSNDGERRSQKPIVDQNADWMTKHMAGKLYLHTQLHPFPIPLSVN